MTSTKPTSKGGRLALALALAALAVLLADRYSIHTFHEANSAGRVYAAQSWVEFGRWDLAPILCRTGPNHALVDMSFKDGLPHLQKAPGLSWLAVPVYAAARAAVSAHIPFHRSATILALLCVALPLLLVTAALGRRLVAETDARAGTLAAVAVLLASPLHTQAMMMQDYPLAAALLVGGALLLRGPASHLVAGGLLLGAAGTVNYAFFLYGGAVLAVELTRRIVAHERPLRFVALLAAGGLLPVLALLIYNQVLWGSPLRTGYDFMASAGQRASHAAVGFTWATLLETLVGPKHGFLFHTPWTALGLLGLLLMLRDPRVRWQGATGLAVVVCTVAFTAVWESSNADVLPFGRHTVGIYPWLGWGLAHTLHATLQRPEGARRAVVGVALGTIAVATFYQVATAWTFPYHSDSLVSPLWQINIPLLVTGPHLVPVPWTLLHLHGAVGPEHLETSWWGPLVAGGLAVASLAAALWVRRGAPTALQRWTPALAATVTAALLLAQGIASDPVSPEVRAWAESVPPSAAQALPARQRALWKMADRASREFESARTDLLGSTFTRPDPLWKDAGYEATNRWCGPPSDAPPAIP